MSIFAVFPEYYDWALYYGLDSTLKHMQAIGLFDIFNAFIM